jgi:hypothetical protein
VIVAALPALVMSYFPWRSLLRDPDDERVLDADEIVEFSQ